MRILAGALVVAAAAFAVVAFAAGDDPPDRAATQTPAPATPAADHPGLDVWIEHGCGGCHTLAAAAATGTFGPDLELSLRGKDAAYIREGIVAPAAAAAPGYDAMMMPEDYAARIPPDDLEALVSFLRESAR